MADTGYLYGGAASSETRASSNDAWDNPTRVLDAFVDYYDYSTRAKTSPQGGYFSDWLRVTDFGFTIPTSAAIDGLEVYIRRMPNSTSRHFNYDSIRWRITSGQVGDEVFPGETTIPDWIFTGGYADTIGGPSSTFGRTWTATEINSSDFGVDISCNQDVDGAYYAHIYTVEVKIYYTETGGGGVSFEFMEISNPAKIMGIDSFSRIMEIGLDTEDPSGWPIVSMAAATASCAQTAGTKTIAVNLSQESAQTVTVEWGLFPTGTYDAAQFTTFGSGQDVGPESGSITFSPGEVSKNITLTVYDIFKITPDLVIDVRLTNADFANVSTSLYNTRLTITDTDKTSGCDFDMTDLPVACPIGGGCSGWGGASWNLTYGSTTYGATNKTNLQNFLNHFKTNHSGSKCLCRFPAGTCYLNLKSTNIELPTANNRWTFIGVKDGRSLDATGHSIIKYCPDYWSTVEDDACFLRNYNAGSYELSAASSLNAVLVRAMIIDPDNLNCGNVDQLLTVPIGDEDADYYLEHYTVIKLRGYDSTKKLSYTTEKIKIQNSPTGAQNAGYYSDLYLYDYEAENCVKSFATQSGIYSTVYAYNVRQYGDRYGGNIWQESAEPSPRVLRIIGDGLTLENTSHMTVAPYEGGNDIKNLYVGKFSTIYQPPTSANIAINHFWSALSGSGVYDGGTIYTFQGSKIHFTGQITWKNIDFIFYDHPKFYNSDGSVAPYLRYLSYTYNNIGPYYLYENCTFRAESKCPGYFVYGFGVLGGKSWTDKTDAYTKFNGCTFEASLDGALKVGYSNSRDGNSLGGCHTIEFNGCTFNTNNNKPLFTLNAWSDATYTGRLIINGATIAPTITQIYYIPGYGDTTDQHKCWIYHSYNLTKTQARESISAESTGITNLSIANAACYARISAIPKAAETTVTTTSAHGLVDNDKIFFDGFHDSSNADWFTNLSPHSSVPYFTVEYVSTTQFKVRNWADSAYIDSSAYSADYNNAVDLALVSRYPARIISSEAGYDPTASLPAGMIGDRWNAGGTYYKCTKSGIQGISTWAAE